jgi:hypothetical protein
MSSLETDNTWFEGFSKAKWFPTIFLFFGLILIGFLYFLKVKEAQIERDFTIAYEQHKAKRVKSPLSLPHVMVDLGSHAIYVTKTPILNRQFHAFVEDTEFITWRERYNVRPTWRFPNDTTFPPSLAESWKVDPEASALWLVEEDAKAFCIWLSDQHKEISPYLGGILEADENIAADVNGFRLPSVLELEAAKKNGEWESREEWEWTSDTLYTLSAEKRDMDLQYLTGWHPTEPLRHRRARQMSSSDAVPMGFRVSWRG